MRFEPGSGPIRQKSAFLPEDPDNRRISAHIERGQRRTDTGANPLLMRDSGGRRVPSGVNRTQEVGGSNPPSSIEGMACTWAASVSEAVSNRSGTPLPFQALVPEIAGMRGG